MTHGPCGSWESLWQVGLLPLWPWGTRGHGILPLWPTRAALVALWRPDTDRTGPGAPGNARGLALGYPGPVRIRGVLRGWLAQVARGHAGGAFWVGNQPQVGAAGE